MKPFARAAVAGCAAVLTVALIVSAAQAGLANAAARELSNEIGGWTPAGPRADTSAALRGELGRIAARAPDRAYVVEMIGIAAARDRADPQALDEALARFSEALIERPVSAYTWANVVHASYELGHTGAAFQLAFRHAAQMGPWEPQVQNTLVSYGLAVRDEVTPQARAVIDQVVADAMRRNPLETLQIAARRGRLDVACRGVVNPASDTTRRYLMCEQREKNS